MLPGQRLIIESSTAVGDPQAAGAATPGECGGSRVHPAGQSAGIQALKRRYTASFGL